MLFVAGNGTIKNRLSFFSFVFKLFVRVLKETCYSRLTKWYRKRGGCVYVCICVIALMCVRINGRVVPRQ